MLLSSDRSEINHCTVYRRLSWVSDYEGKRATISLRRTVRNALNESVILYSERHFFFIAPLSASFHEVCAKEKHGVKLRS